MTANEPAELRKLYELRFEKTLAYRKRVWATLIRHRFQGYIEPHDAVLDLGCGYGEFINQIRCGRKLAMDLNPDARKHLAPGIELIEQDCSTRWPLAEGALQAVFTSNFFEHLPSKAALKATLEEACRCLAPGGKLIAMGPNIKFLAGSYWDFWDHHLALSEASLSEGMASCGFEIAECIDRFLPFSMADERKYTDFVIATYLALPLAWQFFGKQFLIVAVKGLQH